jgi:hypothetical protein
MKFISLTAVLLASAAAAAGCGGGGGGAATASSTTGASNNQVKFSQCMREHGITNFPDPDSQGRVQLEAGDGTGIDPQSPQFKAAQQACQKLQPHAPGSFDRANAQQMQAAALKFAQCMRSHGVNFPDPKFESGGRVMFGGPGIDPNTPTFKAASKACAKNLPNGKGGPIGAGDGK